MDRHTEIEKGRATERKTHTVRGTEILIYRQRHCDMDMNTDGQTYRDRERLKRQIEKHIQ